MAHHLQHDQIIDLTDDKPINTEDHLTKLPSELLHLIFDYLFVQHDPDIALRPASFSKPSSPPNSHDLDYIAATSKLLRREVNNWAIHFLTQHETITKFKVVPAKPKSKSKNSSKTINYLRNHHGLLTWTSKHCIFCGKTSTRDCILTSSFRCCKHCEKSQYPDMITKTQARTNYYLSDEHLFPHRHPRQKLASNYPHGLPKIRYGSYYCQGVPTTMFLEKDVKWLATQYHGDLEEFKKKRVEEKERKRQRKEERKAAQHAAREATNAATNSVIVIDGDDE